MTTPTKKVVTGVDLLSNPDIARFLQGSHVTGPAQGVAVAAPPSPDLPAPTPPAVEPLLEMETPTPVPENKREKYLKDLEKVGVTRERAAEIIQAMIFGGSYEETLPVTKQLSVRFRTRDARANDRLNDVINRENPQFPTVLYSIVSTYNLAASLVEYGPLKFDPTSEEGFQKTLNYIKTKIPLPVFQLLIAKLSKFDEKLTIIMQDGCVEDFF